MASILLACVLLAAAAGVLALEVFIVSYGLLAIVSLALALASILVAFSASAWLGWAFLVIAPVIGLLIVRWGMERLRRSSWVPKAEITADAGYHHAAAALGIRPGAMGVLLNDALPTGRARFTGGELDVQAAFGRLDRGQTVRLVRFEGAVAYVEAAPAENTSPTP